MRCHRCAGLVVTQYGETHCMNCGYYENDPLPAPFISPRMMGTNQCSQCSNMRAKYSKLCLACGRKQHAEAL